MLFDSSTKKYLFAFSKSESPIWFPCFTAAFSAELPVKISGVLYTFSTFIMTFPTYTYGFVYVVGTPGTFFVGIAKHVWSEFAPVVSNGQRAFASSRLLATVQLFASQLLTD